MKKIVALSGSLRQGSCNTHLLQAARELIAAGRFNIEIAPINEILPYNYDIEANSGIPVAVTTLKDKIIAADALLISTPEYNHGIPGVMKNAIDWLSRPPEDIAKTFHNKKVGLIGAGASRLGTAFAQTAWLPIFRCLNMHPYFEKSLYVSDVSNAFNEKGELVNPKLRKLLQEYLDGFCKFIQ